MSDVTVTDRTNQAEGGKRTREVKGWKYDSADHPDHEHANAPQGVHLQALAPAISERKKPLEQVKHLQEP